MGIRGWAFESQQAGNLNLQKKTVAKKIIWIEEILNIILWCVGGGRGQACWRHLEKAKAPTSASAMSY